MKDIVKIYSRQGKEIPLKVGVVVYPGSMVQDMSGAFHTISSKKMIRQTRESYEGCCGETRHEQKIVLMDIE